MSEDLRFLIFFIGWLAGVVLFIRWMNARKRRRMRAEREGAAAGALLFTPADAGGHATADPDSRNWFERLLNQPTSAECGWDSGGDYSSSDCGDSGGGGDGGGGGGD